MIRLRVVHLKLIKSVLRAEVEFKFYFCVLEEGYIIILHHEYNELFASLFSNSKSHYLLMNKLATHWKGYTQIELAKLLKVTSGSIHAPLNELYASNFVSKSTKFGQTKREIVYRATDCFSYFHHKWIKTR